MVLFSKMGKGSRRENIVYYFVMNKPLNFIYRVRKNKIEDLINQKGLPEVQ